MTFLFREQWSVWCVQRQDHRLRSWCLWPGLTSAIAPAIPEGGRPCGQCQREMAWQGRVATRDLRRGAAA